jgi:hypothetical protein
MAPIKGVSPRMESYAQLSHHDWRYYHLCLGVDGSSFCSVSRCFFVASVCKVKRAAREGHLLAEAILLQQL